MTGDAPDSGREGDRPVPIDRIFGEGWELDPGESDAVVEFTKPSVEFRVSPPVRPTSDYLDGDGNRAYGKPTEVPDAVSGTGPVADAFESGWVISNPAEFDVYETEDGEIGTDDLDSQAQFESVEYGSRRVVRISTRWRVEADPPRPLLVIHPVFQGHDRFTTLTQVVHPEQYRGDLQIYLDVNQVPTWVQYDEPLAQVVPMPAAVAEGMAATVGDGTGP